MFICSLIREKLCEIDWAFNVYFSKVSQRKQISYMKSVVQMQRLALVSIQIECSIKNNCCALPDQPLGPYKLSSHLPSLATACRAIRVWYSYHGIAMTTQCTMASEGRTAMQELRDVEHILLYNQLTLYIYIYVFFFIHVWTHLFMSGFHWFCISLFCIFP